MSLIGKKILSYEIKSFIAEGGMGDVYLAEHVQLGRKVAIKSLHPQLVRNEALRARFKKEASVMSHLQHNGIVGMYDFLEEENGLFLVLEYVDGMPLDEYIRKVSGPIPYERALPIMSQVLDAVAYAHDKGVVHRDIKPANILITKEGQIKILDFGIAKLMSDASNKLTRTGTQMGTVYYMSPEQVKGQQIDSRTDIYSLGVTLFQVLTGDSPYQSITTEFEVYNKIVSEPLAAASTIYPGVPHAIDKVIAKATQKAPEARFQNCRAFLSALNGTTPAEIEPVGAGTGLETGEGKKSAGVNSGNDSGVLQKGSKNVAAIAGAALAAIAFLIAVFSGSTPGEKSAIFCGLVLLGSTAAAIAGLIFKQKSKGWSWTFSLWAIAINIVTLLLLMNSGSDNNIVVADNVDSVKAAESDARLERYNDSVVYADSIERMHIWRDSILAAVNADQAADSAAAAAQWEDLFVEEEEEKPPVVFDDDPVVVEEEEEEEETLPATATFSKIWLEHNAVQDGVKGMSIHVSFTVQNMKGKTCQVACYFFHQDGSKVYSSGEYTTPSGHMVVTRDCKPGYDDTRYSDFVVFMPYSAMSMSAGDYKVKAYLWNGTEELDSSDNATFKVTK